MSKVFKINVRLKAQRADGSSVDNKFCLSSDTKMGTLALCNVFMQCLQVNENDVSVQLFIEKEEIDYEEKHPSLN